MVQLCLYNDASLWVTRSTGGRQIDIDMKIWIKTGKMPSQNAVALWLLNRMVFIPSGEENNTMLSCVIFGERGAEAPVKEMHSPRESELNGSISSDLNGYVFIIKEYR